MLGAVVREHREPVPEGGGLLWGPETQPHLGIATSPTAEVPRGCSASMQGAEAGVGCVGSRPQGSGSWQCLLVLQSLGCTVPVDALQRGQSLVLACAGTGHV